MEPQRSLWVTREIFLTQGPLSQVGEPAKAGLQSWGAPGVGGVVPMATLPACRSGHGPHACPVRATGWRRLGFAGSEVVATPTPSSRAPCARASRSHHPPRCVTLTPTNKGPCFLSNPSTCEAPGGSWKGGHGGRRATARGAHSANLSLAVRGAQVAMDARTALSGSGRVRALWG